MSDTPNVAAFVHLRVHSAYSLLEGAIAVKKLPKLCAEHGMPAVAIADTDNLFGALEFSEVLAKAGVQPIVGCQLRLDHAPAEQPGEKGAEPAPIVLLAQNETGYVNLMKLVSDAYMLGDAGSDPILSWEDLEASGEGLICLTGGPNGPVGDRLLRGRRADAESALDRLSAAFPQRLYVELHRHGSDGALRTDPEAETEPAFLEMAYRRDLPIVAVNEVFFPTADLYEAHDAMMCIAEGRYVTEDDRRRLTPENRFKSPAQMIERFADLPEAVEATVEVAQRCAYRPRTHAPILPKFADDEVAELRRLSNEGLDARLAAIEPSASREAYQERLDYELGIIERMGFPGYFLIVADFIQWAKARGIPVGPGRGSGAGSLVAYALTITNLDPLRYQLLFERFLNPERVSMPDFDIDFCQDRRDEVIRYVQEKYGRDRVAQIITFGKLQARAALRDVGRVLQMSYSQVDRLCKLVPNNPANPVTLAEAIEGEPRLQEAAKAEYVVGRLLEISQSIEGLYRHASTHAAGVVIGDRPLEELVPLYRDPRSDMPVTQFNMKWVEPAGLVKFDFLGLKTLTVIQNALDILAARGIDIDIEAIPLDDKRTYDLYSSADTVAVFQVESPGMREALRQLQPSCIEDIVALVALYRPGPMENIPKYCHVKHGQEKPDYLHPMLEPILKETQGIIVYQEQVMQIAQVMANYSLGGADLLRRAMGKKIKEAMDAERPKFLNGAAENGVEKAKAQEVWDLLEKFANYGFNKSHAAAYGYVSYQTAWLKANHPVAFMAAVMNLDMQYTEKLAVYRQELRRMAIPLAPPNVNRSDVSFSVEDGDDGAETIRYALGALKNVGRDAMRQIVEERHAGGDYVDLLDFARRLDLKSIGKRALENLARAGAFDALEPQRRRAFDAIDTLVAYSTVVREETASSQTSFFGDATGLEAPPPKLPAPHDWTPADKLNEEAAAIGFYLSGHPLDDYADALRAKRVMSLNEYSNRAAHGFSARVAAKVVDKRERRNKRGDPFAFVQLSDPTGLFEVMVFTDVLVEKRALLEPGAMVVLAVDAEASFDGEQLRFKVAHVEDLDKAVADAEADIVQVHLSDGAAAARVAQILEACGAEPRPAPEIGARPPRGMRRLELVLAFDDARKEAVLDTRLIVAMTPGRRSALKAGDGVLDVREIRTPVGRNGSAAA